MDPNVAHHIPVSMVHLLSQDMEMSEALDEQSMSRLPRYALGYILLLASQTDGLTASDYSTWIARKTAIFSSQVNQEWRAAALGQPAIWLGPVFSWHSAPQWLEIVLERSSPLPLNALIPHGVPSSVIYLALSHLPRIRHLRFEIKTQDAWQVAEKQLRHFEAPRLESLSVHGPLAGGKQRRLFQVSLDSKILRGHAPLLRNLRTINCAVDLNNPLFHKLKVLEITNMQYVPVSHILDALGEMTDLEELAITRPSDNASFSNFHIPLAALRRIPMTGLKRLFIAAPISACADIMKNIVLSKSCSLALSLRNFSRANMPDLGFILAYLKKAFEGWGEGRSIQQLLHTGANRVSFGVQVEPDDYEDDDQLPPSPPVNLEISWLKGDWEDFEKVFTETIAAFERCPVPETLTLSADADIFSFPLKESKRFLALGLGSLGETVYKVEFRNHDAFAFYGQLLRHTPWDQEATSHRLLLPCMTDMALNAVDFGAQRRAAWSLLKKILDERSDTESVVMDLQVANHTGGFSARYLSREFGVDVTENDAHLSSSDDSGEDDSDCADFTVQEEDSDYQMKS